MVELRVKKRKRIKARDLKALIAGMEDVFGNGFLTEDDQVEIGSGTDMDFILVDGDIIGMIIDETPFLTVKGLLKYKPETRYVTVDMGAVPYVTNGAAVMGPGIVDADPQIKEGDLVWIRDINNKAPLAVGKSLKNYDELMTKEKGRAIEPIHNVGDKIWKYGS